MINLVEDIKPISYVKSHTAEILKQVGEKTIRWLLPKTEKQRPF
jgi:predicted nucleic acid-binding OB-fold protein